MGQRSDDEVGGRGQLDTKADPTTSDLMQMIRTLSDQNEELQSRLSRLEVKEQLNASAQEVTWKDVKPTADMSLSQALEESRRRSLPERIILVRHGESEGNADVTLYRTKADNLVELTERGTLQAKEAGKRIRKVVGNSAVLIQTSPFQRTLQTARNIRECLPEEQLAPLHVDPRLREQEFGNLQGEDFKNFRKEQVDVGRFYYRFPTGESGADVYLRVRNWWIDKILHVNDFQRAGSPPVESVVVVTHGLTMRLILMQLFDWSPNTFHTVWNAKNCEIYVLKRQLSNTVDNPYVLDFEEGDTPLSSIALTVMMKDGQQHEVSLQNYLDVPSPRTRQLEIVSEMLASQYPSLFPDASQIDHIDFFGGRFRKFQ
ncbi:hypothetical protein CYMTET_6185 [Cymbomonas tetramitiformis]|uniref:Phosphoglycerate mutase n=1 Tax=Cymbomonas tetramitiformis TaxID=36881 RepID=A0AAE0GXY5_9CHLO|nr:hypothetical protein CYMTET_6185 [Cymbomonas tetramitiformis]|eukprot:gene18576-22177_t